MCSVYGLVWIPAWCIHTPDNRYVIHSSGCPVELAAQIAAGSLNDVTSKTARQRSKIVAIRYSLPGQNKSPPYMEFTGGRLLTAHDLAHLPHAFRQLLSDGVGSSTSSFRAPVAQSSHPGLKPPRPFSGCCDYAQHDRSGRSMTGVSAA